MADGEVPDCDWQASLTPEEFYLKGSNTGLFLSFDPEDGTVKLSERSSVKEKMDGQIWTRSDTDVWWMPTQCRSGQVLEASPEEGAPVVAAMLNDDDINQRFGMSGRKEDFVYKYNIHAEYNISREQEYDRDNMSFITFMDNDEKPTMQKLESRHGCYEETFEKIQKKKEEFKENVPENVLEEAFKLFTDGSEGITSAKLIEVVKEAGGYMTESEAEALIRKADNDGDNVIDKSEFIKLYRAIMGLEDKEGLERMRAAFKEVDTDNSGYITKEEMMKILFDEDDFTEYGLTMESANAQVRNAIEGLDMDGDGRVSISEFFLSDILSKKQQYQQTPQ